MRLVSLSRNGEKVQISLELSSIVEVNDLETAMGFAREAFERETPSKFCTECINKYTRLEAFFRHIIEVLY